MREFGVPTDYMVCSKFQEKKRLPQEEVAAIVTDSSTPATPRPAAPVRNKYAKPASPAARSQTTGAGGEGDGSSLPRARNGKWHSFLPGMFR